MRWHCLGNGAAQLDEDEAVTNLKPYDISKRGVGSLLASES
jgi:hypothetical protein